MPYPLHGQRSGEHSSEGGGEAGSGSRGVRSSTGQEAGGGGGAGALGGLLCGLAGHPLGLVGDGGIGQAGLGVGGRRGSGHTGRLRSGEAGHVRGALGQLSSVGRGAEGPGHTTCRGLRVAGGCDTRRIGGGGGSSGLRRGVGLLGRVQGSSVCLLGFRLVVLVRPGATAVGVFLPGSVRAGGEAGIASAATLTLDLTVLVLVRGVEVEGILRPLALGEAFLGSGGTMALRLALRSLELGGLLGAEGCGLAAGLGGIGLGDLVELEVLLHGAPRVVKYTGELATALFSTRFRACELNQSTPAVTSGNLLLAGARGPATGDDVVGGGAAAAGYHPFVDAGEPVVSAGLEERRVLERGAGVLGGVCLALGELGEPVCVADTAEQCGATGWVRLAALAAALAEAARAGVVRTGTGLLRLGTVSRGRGAAAGTGALDGLGLLREVRLGEVAAGVLGFLPALLGPGRALLGGGGFARLSLEAIAVGSA